MLKWLPALLFIATSAFAQERATAYDALRVVSSQLGRAAMNHVINVSGMDGDPQPATWNVLLEDSQAPGGVREIQVTNGRVSAEKNPARMVVGSAANSTIKTARLNLDSSGAFSVASRTADKSSTRFATANYTLRTDERGDPVWIVALISASAKPVGTIHINCNRGNVTRTEGMFAGATMDDVEVDRTYQREERTTVERRRGDDNDNTDNDDEDGHGPLSGIRSRLRGSFERAQDEARGMFDRVRRSFDDTLNR